MSQSFLTPDRLFDCPWHPGHAFGRRPSRRRRMSMLLLLFFFCSIIWGYLYITDSDRVRLKAEQYLTQLIGGKVEVGGATLSIFEGLRLKEVRILVDSRQQAPDSVLFSADQFHLKYGIRELLAGRIEAAQIVAIEPHVYLTENLDTGTWNYQRMPRPGRETTSKPTTANRTLALPEIILRNAQLKYSAIRGGEPETEAAVTIEAHCVPSTDGRQFLFELQSHGGEGDRVPALWPMASGAVDRDLRQVTVQVRDIELFRLMSMLPNQVRQFAKNHDLTGRVDVPALIYTPGRKEGDYRVAMELNSVKLKVQPQEWLSSRELQRQGWIVGAMDFLDGAGLNGHGAVDYYKSLVKANPIELNDVSGRFEFTQAGISIIGMKGRVEGNLLHIDGEIKGYSPTDPISLHVSSDPVEHIVIPTAPRYMSSMPKMVIDIYDQIHPWGKCDLALALNRPTDDSRLEVAGAVQIVDGGFCYSKFAYPMRNASGRVEFGPDPATGFDRVRLINLRGKGVLGGPNQNVSVTADGEIGPLNGDPAVNVIVSAQGVHSEPALHHAFPWEVKEALAMLDADGEGKLPSFTGGFVVTVKKNIGSPRIFIDTQLKLSDGAGKVRWFPYPLTNIKGDVHIEDGAVHINNVRMNKPDGSELVVDGVVSWRAGIGRALEPGEREGQFTPVRPDLKFTATNVAIDKDLLDALPADHRNWLLKVGAAGRFDLTGRVFSDVRAGILRKDSAAPGADLHQQRAPFGEYVPVRSDEEISHEFAVKLKNGSIWPVDGTFAVSNLSGTLNLYPNRMEIKELAGQRGAGAITASGLVSWPNNRPALSLDVLARNLELDQTLYHILPAGARAAWDAVHPEGSVDADLKFRGDATLAATQPARSAQSAATQPAQPALAGLDLAIRPRKLAVTLQSVPYRLEDVQGAVRVAGGKVSVEGITAKHGAGTVAISGTGQIDKLDWDLKLKAESLPLDDALRKAMPAALATMTSALKFTGVVSFEFPRLLIRESPAPTQPGGAVLVRAPVPAATKPAETPLDIDFVTRIKAANATIDLGMPLSDFSPTIELAGSVRNSKLDALAGPVDAASASIGNRPLKNLHLELYKPSGHDALRVGNIRAQLAGGEVAGQVDIAFPNDAASKYVMNLVLRGADCRELTGEQDIAGEMNASLAMEGDWSNPANRRGRGDVSVGGKSLYKMPLVLGLLQITNLSLPLTSPFNEGSARYSVDGQKVTFESIEVRAKDMLISGSGQLDFNTRKVNLTFTTDNPNWPKLPILGDIMQTAKQELLQIHVKGTLKEPKVSATAMNTVTTTVDEVFKGNK